MQEIIVDFETAVMLKSEGFDWLAYHYYSNNNEESYGAPYNYNNYEQFHSRPSLSVAADWLRSKGLHVAVNITFDGWYWQVIFVPTAACLKEEPFIDNHGAALSAGITAALLILKSKEK